AALDLGFLQGTNQHPVGKRLDAHDGLLLRFRAAARCSLRSDPGVRKTVSTLVPRLLGGTIDKRRAIWQALGETANPSPTYSFNLISKNELRSQVGPQTGAEQAQAANEQARVAAPGRASPPRDQIGATPGETDGDAMPPGGDSVDDGRDAECRAVL